MTLAQSPPPMCLCGHDFHTGPCDGCHCPDGELDGDR